MIAVAVKLNSRDLPLGLYCILRIAAFDLANNMANCALDVSEVVVTELFGHISCKI